MCDKQIFENVNQKSFTFIWQSFCARCGSRGGSCRIEREREGEGEGEGEGGKGVVGGVSLCLTKSKNISCIKTETN